ncbi:LPP20 family lipoprotein [Ancylomarina longa]|uniref:LPP20 lipoprotein n=1 Tax=Ancylomarina longa TaxID=2487017 RepID=A0A434AGJ4_9BACT|nr:LPP20 family lipoprotein [Ancylomarina longa]RUT73515.1 hypothetical protein DLK05_13015 [Ancylomarina longa]
MKTRKLHQSIFLGLGILLATGLNSCGSSEKIVSNKAQGEELIEVYCTGPDYQSDKNHFRASAIGESLDQMVSKKKAGTNARAELATLIQSTVQGTIDNYVNSTELNNVEQVEERFEGLTREVINQQLNNIKVICEKQTRTGQNKYKTYIAIEMNADDLEEVLNQKISQDEKLKVDYDYNKFKETFETEMQKLKAQQSGI